MRVKLSSYLELLRGLSLSKIGSLLCILLEVYHLISLVYKREGKVLRFCVQCVMGCGLRAVCCKLRGKIERDCERG